MGERAGFGLWMRSSWIADDADKLRRGASHGEHLVEGVRAKNASRWNMCFRRATRRIACGSIHCIKLLRYVQPRNVL